MSETNKQSSLVPMAIVATLFFILGFATWLNGSLMPFLQQILQLSPFQASLIIFSFYIAVTFTAIPSAMIIRKVGYKNGMALGMATMMVAGLLFIPAAKTQVFALFLFAQLVMGAGQTLLQTAVNPYVVRIGPEESAAARVSVMGILNKGAGVIAPIVFTALILSDFTGFVGKELTQSDIDAMANGLILPYLGMAIFIGVLGFAVTKMPLPELIDDADEQKPGQVKEALSHPSLALGIVALFVYVAVEVIAGDTIGSFALSLGVEKYSVMTSYTMGCMVLGYFLGILLIPRILSQQVALTISAILGCALTIAIVTVSNESVFISTLLGLKSVLPDTLLLIAVLGFANAIVWPAVWPLALSGLGKLTSVGSGLLVMGIAGGAFGPLFWGLASGGVKSADAQQAAYIVMLPCYLFILFYALKGHKMKSWK
ncbi:sugar MFS transporter [Pseudoalteromonas sp. N1230-9]|jgi:glucose/galactose transporter|uniref:N-acetylglucosamine MFS transporter NagP n=1 Tax=unclassified Pseudoalteromonas TaxID=194690 RepID=UPI001022B476|nr:glucose/galactose MFS transporter [Pseudoalteromonas sp. CO302Y]RZG07047.1 glucose/galactose MFS transporter [Pseudoalteromonas sp. CO133X]WOC26625.1 sugar MFS transporter [Pseudoalteromonas sp. N1230-9]